jgi:AGCS family alanine or glycine:cation symporter
MAIAYVVMSLMVIGLNIQAVPAALATVVDSAFNGASAAGGLLAPLSGLRSGLA